MELPVKPYIKSRLKTSYAVEGPEDQYLVDCGDGVNILTISEQARRALAALPWSAAQTYPHTVEMKEVVARYWADLVELPLPRIFPGEGSQSLLYDTCRLFLEPGDKVLGPGPCYAELASDVGMWGAEYDFVSLRPEQKFRLDTGEMLRRMDGSHKLIYLDTPNNPTGQAVPLEEVEALVRRAAELSTPIIVDEAYGDYLPREQSAITLTDRYDNLVVLRSFSKAHGLAGIRAGYGVLPEQLRVPLDNITHPYICSTPSRLVAQAALEDRGFLDRTRAITAQCKAPFLERTWSHLSVSYTCPETPILLLTHEDPSVDLKRLFDAFLIKVVSGTAFVGLGANSARLRVPAEEYRELVFRAIDAIDRGEPGPGAQ